MLERNFAEDAEIKTESQLMTESDKRLQQLGKDLAFEMYQQYKREENHSERQSDFAAYKKRKRNEYMELLRIADIARAQMDSLEKEFNVYDDIDKRRTSIREGHCMFCNNKTDVRVMTEWDPFAHTSTTDYICNTCDMFPWRYRD